MRTGALSSTIAIVSVFGTLLCAVATANPSPQEQPSASEDTELVPLEIELPEPPFECFAGWFYNSPNFEEPAYKKAPAPLVPEGTANLSRGKRVTTSSTPNFGKPRQLTDGDKSPDALVDLDPGLQWVQIDLGEQCDLAVIVVWRFYLYMPVFHDVIVQTSNDPKFKEGVTTLYNNDWDNSAGFGKGTDKEYVENFQGRRFDARNTRARYLRIYGNGGYYAQDLSRVGSGRFKDGCSLFIEVEAFGKPADKGTPGRGSGSSAGP